MAVGLVLLFLGAGWATEPPPSWAQDPSSRAGVILAVLPTSPGRGLDPAPPGAADHTDNVLRGLEAQGLSVGLVSTVQGRYDQGQALLDLTQGTRQPRALYASDPPSLALEERYGRWSLSNWAEVARRARSASATIEPGLLAGSVPGGASYVGFDDAGTGTKAGDQAGAIVASDRTGRLAGVSLGPVATLAQRVAAARSRHRLVVVGLPPGGEGLAALGSLGEQRSPDDLLVAIQLPPTPPRQSIGEGVPSRFYSQTALALDRRGPPGALTSGSTRQPGLVTAIDVAPTVLAHLGLEVPARMRGQVVESSGTVDVEALESSRRRWNDVRSGRQAASLQAIAAAAALVFLALGTTRGIRLAVSPSLRALGLGLLWWPATAIVVGVAAIRSGPLEAWTIASVAIVLALATDRLLPWPAGPLAPALAGLVVLTADLMAGGALLSRSVLAPSIVSGNRFYGISNEIEPILPILLLSALAALGPRVVSRGRMLYVAGGVALAVVVGAGGLGADVGGVITVAAAMTAAVIALRPARPRLATLALGVAVPLVALGSLIVVDLAIGRRGHLLDNLTRASGPGELWELVARRYQLALGILLDAGNALALAVCCLVVAWAYRNRGVVFADLTPGWRAALIGGLAGGVAGALSNDSGPVLLVNAVISLGAVTAYLAGGPSPADPVASSGRSDADVLEGMAQAGGGV